MIKNYFKIAFRNLLRNKAYALINIVGLAVAIAVCLTIFLVVQFETSYDNFHKDGDRIYRVLTTITHSDESRFSGGVPYPLPDAIRNDFPGMEVSVVHAQDAQQVQVPDPNAPGGFRKYREDGWFYVNPSFFEIFNFPLLAGNYQELKNPDAIVLDRNTANRYFGDWRMAVGKRLRGTAGRDFRVVGVMENVPANTDFQLKIAASITAESSEFDPTDWHSVSSNYCCYVRVPAGMDKAQLDRQLDALSAKYKKDDWKRSRQVAQSLAAVHYDDDTVNISGHAISKATIRTFELIAILILLVAIVNFVNLATAQSANRAREVGVRKVLGSSRRQLRLQFYGETTLIVAAALLLGILIALAGVPLVASILSIPIKLKFFHNPVLIVFLLALCALVVVLAGFYPAMILSGFNPITALKNRLNVKSAKGITLRRGLVIAQFVIAQALIICTLVVLQQMKLFRNRPMGFDRTAILNVDIPADSASHARLPYLRNRLEAVPGVKSVSFSYAPPADDGNWSSNLRFDHAQDETEWSANLKWADTGYLRTYGLTLAAGRNLYAADTVHEFLVTETFLNRLGITDPAAGLNRDIEMWGGQLRGKIVGVVKDFHALSLRRALVPILISTNVEFYEKAGIRIDGKDIAATVQQIDALWDEVFPQFVHEENFLDDKVNNFYLRETKMSQLYQLFAVIAILLSCLGLYGLASFMAVQRVKEVGIRKVLGASSRQILFLFSREFFWLVGIAFLIAAPLAWYYMHQWQRDFVYRVGVSWWVIGLSGLIALLIAMITIGSKALRAAVANPVKNLRTE